MKTIEWLRSQLEDGDVLTAETIGEWLASFWHKSEMGQVDEGETRPVSGDAVAAYVAAKLAVETLKPIVAGLLQEMLPTLLEGYVTGETLREALNGMVTGQWVQNLIADKADLTAVNTALADKADASVVYTKTEADGLLADKAATTDLPDVSGLVSQTALESALAGKANTTDVYDKHQIDSAMAARPTQTEMAGETATSINNAVTDLPNNAVIADIRTKLNAVIVRTNTLSHVACGSEQMNVCPSDISELQAPSNP